MRKQRIEYDSPVDALVAVAKRLNMYETRYKIISEEFYDCYNKGQMNDSEEFVEWSNDYKHYMAIRHDLEERLEHAA